MISQAGIYTLTEDEYHQDPCETASLSASMAKILLGKSPRHAWQNHPKLNPDWAKEEENKFDFGTVAHKLILGEGNEIAVLDYADFRTKASQEARDSARAKGHTPILLKDFATAKAMHEAAMVQLQGIDDCKDAFTGEGHAEAVLAWQEFDYQGQNPIWCRSKVDWLAPRRPTGHIVIYDYKSSGADVSPGGLSRQLFNMEYEIANAMYERGLESIMGDAAGKIVMRFVVQETEPPYLLHVAEIDNGGMMIGRKKVSYAIQLWRRCLMEGNWPGYPTRIVRADMPAYLESKWLERELMEEDGINAGHDPFLEASAWMPKAPLKEIIKLGEGG